MQSRRQKAVGRRQWAESSRQWAVSSKYKTAFCALPSAFFLLFLALLCAPFAPIVRATPDSKSNLLEVGSAAKLRPPSIAPAEIKIVSYNIRWRGGEDLRKLIGLLRDDVGIGGATIIGLQEVDRNKKRTGNRNTARAMAEALNMNYAWAAPPTAKPQQEEETGVAILSPYPMKDVERIVLPHPGPGGRRRVALGATVRIGTTDVRVYSVHAETRISIKKKMEQQRAVLDALARHSPTPCAIVLGDFNTWESRAVRETSRLFPNAGFTTPIPHDNSTFKAFIFIKLKLDWIWLRGLRAKGSGIARQIALSDHWPLWVTAEISTKPWRTSSDR